RTTIGIAPDHNEHWVQHGWRYPPIDFKRFEQKSFLDRPAFIVCTSFEMDTMRRALASPKLSREFVWDSRYCSDWYLSDPPIPPVFEFFQELFAGDRYEPLASFRAIANVPFDGACREVFIYRLKQQPAHASGSH